MPVSDSKPTTTHDPNPQAPVTNSVTVFQVPSLKILAAKAVKNRNQFFTLSNKRMDLEIEQQFIQPMINQLISGREDIYADRIAERQENIDNLSQELSNARWFRKLLSWGLGLGLSGLHVGVYFILRASDDISDQTKLVFITSIPTSLFVGFCIGSCCLPEPLARVIAYCKVPGVSSKEVIDLNEEACKGSLTV